MSAVIRTNGPATFSENDPKYTCCCNNCHVKLGAKIIGYMQLVGIALVLLKEVTPSSSAYDPLVSQEPPPFAVCVMGVFSIAIVVAMLYGVHQERHYYILPYLVMNVINVALAVILTIVVAIALFAVVLLSSGDKEKHAVTMPDSMGKLQYATKSSAANDGGSLMAMVFVVLVMALGVCIGLQIWFFTVVLGCYRYCKNKRNALKDSLAAIEITNPTEFNGTTEPTVGFVPDATVPMAE